MSERGENRYYQNLKSPSLGTFLTQTPLQALVHVLLDAEFKYLFTVDVESVDLQLIPVFCLFGTALLKIRSAEI